MSGRACININTNSNDITGIIIIIIIAIVIIIILVIEARARRPRQGGKLTAGLAFFLDGLQRGGVCKGGVY